MFELFQATRADLLTFILSAHYARHSKSSDVLVSKVTLFYEHISYIWKYTFFKKGKKINENWHIFIFLSRQFSNARFPLVTNEVVTYLVFNIEMYTFTYLISVPGKIKKLLVQILSKNIVRNVIWYYCVTIKISNYQKKYLESVKTKYSVLVIKKFDRATVIYVNCNQNANLRRELSCPDE